MSKIADKINDLLYKIQYYFDQENRCARCNSSWTSRLYDDYDCGCSLKPFAGENFDFEIWCLMPTFIKNIIEKIRLKEYNNSWCDLDIYKSEFDDNIICGSDGLNEDIEEFEIKR